MFILFYYMVQFMVWVITWSLIGLMALMIVTWLLLCMIGRMLIDPHNWRSHAKIAVKQTAPRNPRMYYSNRR